MSKYVTDYSSGICRQKFLSVKGSIKAFKGYDRKRPKDVYFELKLGGGNAPKKEEDEECVKNLNMFKKQSEEEIAR